MNDGPQKLIDVTAERKAKAEERIKRAIDKTCAIIDACSVRNPAVVQPLVPIVMAYVLEQGLAN